MEEMIARWELMENSKYEWKVEGGMRRGGRKFSRRISELLGNFDQKEGDRKLDLETDVDLEGGTTEVTTNFSVVATNSNTEAPSAVNKYGFSSLKLPKYSITKLKKNVIKSGLVSGDIIVSEDRDWLSESTPYKLTANERPASAKKRKEIDESLRQRVAKKICILIFRFVT